MMDPTRKGYSKITDRQLRNADWRLMGGDKLPQIAKDLGTTAAYLGTLLRAWRHNKGKVAR